MKVEVLFLGGTSIDLIQDKRNREEGHPRFNASTGGSITNSAVIGSKLGLKTAIISRIGRDPLGDFAVRFLRSVGINTSGIICDPTIRTPIAITNIDRSGNSKYAFYKNTSKDSIVCFKDAPKKLLKRAKILHFGSSFSYQKETSVEALKYVKFLKKIGVFISFDPNLRPYAINDPIEAKNRVFRLLKWVDLAKLSKIDLEFLTGQKDPKKGLRILKKRFNCHFILTLGSKGSVYPLINIPSPLWGEGKGEGVRFIKIPAFKVKIADTIGAGDGFTAGLLFRLNKIGKRAFFSNIKPNIVFASAVAAIICTKSGANQALKNLRQVEKFLSKQ